MHDFLEDYELWETVTEYKPLSSLLENPLLVQIKSNNKQRTKKSKSRSLMQNVVADSML